MPEIPLHMLWLRLPTTATFGRMASWALRPVFLFPIYDKSSSALSDKFQKHCPKHKHKLSVFKDKIIQTTFLPVISP